MNLENIQRNVVSENDIINNIKGLAIDMIHQAGSGHPGIALGAAPILYTLFTRHLNINLNDTEWINRDRFVMSAGHGSALLYATLFFAGYNLTIDDLKAFRKSGSKTPGHPEYRVTPGVEVSTGPLGQGLATAVGLALGGKIIEDRFKLSPQNKHDRNLRVFDHYIYVLCGDGDLMEGVAQEASSFAGSHNLSNLIILYDSNRVSLDGETSHTFTENVCEKFRAMGFYTDVVKNGESISEIDRAISKAKKENKPALIEIRTVIGRGSLLEGTNEVHGKPLSDDDILQLKKKLNLSNEPFAYSDFLRAEMQKRITEHSSKKYNEWAVEYPKIRNMGIYHIDFLFNKDKPISLLNYSFNFPSDYKDELRNTNADIMQIIKDKVPNFLGGSADLASSTKVYLHNESDINKTDYTGSNIWFGVREHAMGAILNGLALCNLKVYGSTFLSFADYMKPAMRLAALMKIDPTFIFTHDSVSIGSDGPTHQPIEQLAMLRSIPLMKVFRPADANEIVGSWEYILQHDNHPNTLVISKSEVPLLNTNPANVLNGGYIIKKEEKYLHGIIIATGTEVHTALQVAYELKEKDGLDIRVVSMPCVELFKEQSQEYQKQVLPEGVRTFVIEAGSSFGWHEFVYNSDYLITIDKFGVSGTKNEVLQYCHFNYESIINRIRLKLK